MTEENKPNPVAPESYKPAEEVMPTATEDDDRSHIRRSAKEASLKTPGLAASPVTVEAPENLAYQFKEELNAKLDAALATPKPIGDVEAVAQQCAEIVAVTKPSYLREQTIKLWEPRFTEILSPFFAPAGPNSATYTVSYEFLHKIWQATGSVPQGVNNLCAGVYELNRDAYSAIESLFNGDPAQPPCSECATPSDKWYMEYQAAVARAVQAEDECATLRKERDDAQSELFLSGVELTKQRSLAIVARLNAALWQGKLQAAEAQLSTLRDALENKLNRALSDAKDLNGYATNDDGGLGMRLLKVACHTTGMIMRLERELKEIAAPTPEVAPKEGQES